MKARFRRGTVILGMIAVIALLGFLAYAANSAALSNYREASRLRWRLSARQLAQGGLATARARLADNSSWTGEAWSTEGVGRVDVRVLPLADPPSPASPSAPSSPYSPRPDLTVSPSHASAIGPGVCVVEITASVPPGLRPQETVVLRARLDPSTSSGALPIVDTAWWVNATAAGSSTSAAEEESPGASLAPTDDPEARP